MIPLIVYGSLKLGGLILGKNNGLIFDQDISIELARNHLKQYLYGSILLAIIVAMVCGLIALVTIKIFRK